MSEFGQSWRRTFELVAVLASLDALIRHLGGAADASRTEPGCHDGRPVRGFVFPPRGQD